MSSRSQEPPLITLGQTEGYRHRESGKGSRRTTIGVLLDYINFFSRGYQTQLRNAMHAEAHRLGIDLLFYFGRALEEPNLHSVAHNKIFQLMHPDTLDGMIVMSTCLCAYCGTEGMHRYFQGWPRIPSCSIGVAVPGVPSILVDNRRGMSDVVEHLIVEHGCRRLAFIKGSPANPESDLRFDGYCSVLARHGIEIDPALLAVGHFFKQEGHAAMAEILARKVPIDAVVAANDNMALGAIELLSERGLRVPDDLPVTGFDDLELAKAGNPPLTTVRQPFKLMAETAIRIVLDQIEGRAVSECTDLATEFVVRHSCGCDRRIASIDASSIARSPEGAIQYLERDAERITATLTECMEVEDAERLEDAEELLEHLKAELAGRPGALLRAVGDFLQRPTHADYQNHRALHDAITYLRGELRPFSTPALEDLWFEASRRINGASTTAQALHRVKADENYLHLLVAGEQSSAALDLPSLKAVLEKNLPEMGVTTAFLSRYVGGTSNELEPFVHVRDGAVRATTAERFPDYQLVPQGFWRYGAPGSWLVFPLAFEGQLLGVAVFQFLSREFGYDVIRDQISASLRSVELHHEVVEKTALHERSVQERLATTNRMQSLSVLAGGVAHDLNNVLGPLVALPDIMLRDLAGWRLPDSAVADVRNDIESIKAASLRATQTIKDLLTLARQGQMARELLDLNRLTANCLTDGSVRFVRDERHRVRVLLDLTPEITTIRGSESHLVRAITNLVRNAMEAIAGSGEVKVSTSVERVTETLVGYEAIEPGDYVVLSVVDNGRGIPKSELGRVFEPFYSKKRYTETSGTGLGLAIVHGVVKDHEGFIDVVSAETTGTTFRLYLPRVSERVHSSRPLIAEIAGHARVLIVDDEPVQLRTGRRVLSRLGYEVETLDSGEQAYQLFRKAAEAGTSPYDLVIFDMILNEPRDGLEIVEQIREWFPTQRAIVASGHAPTERAQLAVSRGLTWLAKPYTAEALARTVQGALTGRI